nr:MAG TPA: hypothetical protein [Caudoviricetes sp.]
MPAWLQTSVGSYQTLRISTSPSTRVTSDITVNYVLKPQAGSNVFESITLSRAQNEVTKTIQGNNYLQVKITSLSPTEDSNYYYRF